LRITMEVRMRHALQPCGFLIAIADYLDSFCRGPYSFGRTLSCQISCRVVLIGPIRESAITAAFDGAMCRSDDLHHVVLTGSKAESSAAHHPQFH